MYILHRTQRTVVCVLSATIVFMGGAAHALQISAESNSLLENISPPDMTGSDGPNIAATGQVTAGTALDKLDGMFNIIAHASSGGQVDDAGNFAGNLNLVAESSGLIGFSEALMSFTETYTNSTSDILEYTLDLTLDDVLMVLQGTDAINLTIELFVEVDSSPVWDAGLTWNDLSGVRTIITSGAGGDIPVTSGTMGPADTLTLTGYAAAVDLGTLNPTESMTVKFSVELSGTSFKDIGSIQMGTGGASTIPGVASSVSSAVVPTLPLSKPITITVLCLALLAAAAVRMRRSRTTE